MEISDDYSNFIELYQTHINRRSNADQTRIRTAFEELKTALGKE